MKLYSYFRSTAAYRIRIALNLKGLDAQIIPVNLVKGEHKAPEYLAHNPQGLVPLLVTDEGDSLNQSMAILDYLETTYPQPRLLPQEALASSQVRSFCYEIACDIHPLNNLRVLQYLEGSLGVSPEEKQSWYAHWIATGFATIEARLQQSRARAQETSGPFCFGSAPTWGDCLLIPQVYNANRFNCDLSACPRITEINEHCLTLDAFKQAAPQAQPDAP